ncbi:MAG TPA: hypothetical protein VGI40_14670 [Pirellulaceae bacterium]
MAVLIGHLQVGDHRIVIVCRGHFLRLNAVSGNVAFKTPLAERAEQ